MHFCPACGSLLRHHVLGGQKVARCPNCGPVRDPVGNAQAETPAPRFEPGGPGYFPYARVREGQQALLDDVARAARDRRILVAHAPTGLGKTVSTLAPLVEHAVQHDKRVFFLTSKQSQHKIAVDTLRAIRDKTGKPIVVADLIGKQDMCPRREARELFSNRFSQFCRKQQVSKQCTYYVNSIDETHGNKALRLLRSRVHHVEEAVIECTDLHVCPHQSMVDLAQGAHVVVCDYNYLFSDMRESMQERLKVDLSEVLLVVDEAHNLPDRIRDHLTLELNDYTIENAIDELKDVDEPRLAKMVDRLRAALDLVSQPPQADPPARDTLKRKGGTLAAFGAVEAAPPRQDSRLRDGERFVTRDEFVAAVNETLSKGVERLTIADYESLLTDLQEAQEAYEKRHKEAPRGIGGVREFLQMWKIERRGLARVFTRDPLPTLRYLILDPSVLAKPVFDAVHCAVVMSGTLYPAEMYRDVLGLEPERADCRVYASPFDAANRLVLVDEAVTTAYQERSPEAFERIARRLGAFADETPGNVAAFFPSYTILEEVRHYVDAFTKKTIVVEEREHSKEVKEGLVKRLRRDGDCLLLAVQGGSLSEGYDYEDNLLSAVAIVGLPFAAPSLAVQSLIDYYEKKFGNGRGRLYGYVHPTMSRVLQAAGRLIRSERDRGVILLMDKRFAWGMYRACFPNDFSPRPAREPADEARRFWTHVRERLAR